jgi:hypothetical protein
MNEYNVFVLRSRVRFEKDITCPEAADCSVIVEVDPDVPTLVNMRLPPAAPLLISHFPAARNIPEPNPDRIMSPMKITGWLVDEPTVKSMRLDESVIVTPAFTTTPDPRTRLVVDSPDTVRLLAMVIPLPVLGIVTPVVKVMVPLDW